MKRNFKFFTAIFVLAILTSITFTATSAGAKYWPNTGSSVEISPYRPYLSGGHEGVDMLAPSNGIVAHRDGTVMFVFDGCNHIMQSGTCCKVPGNLGFYSYGNVIVIKHKDDNNNTYFTLYAHLVYGSTKVSVGDTVYAGQRIATMGGTGWGTCIHLHFETRTGTYSSSGFTGMTHHNPSNYLTNATKLAAPIPQPTYTVTYTANASGVTNMPASPKSKTHGQAFTISSKTPKRTGYTFA